MEGIPVILVAGKKLEERTSYVRVIFKDKRMFAVKSNHSK